MKQFAGIVIFCFVVAISGFAQEPEMYKLVGFATETTGTTGGAGGTAITVTTGTELQNALDNKDAGTPLTIYVDGLINEANSPGLSKIDIKEVEDVTVLGLGSTAEFDGIGIKIFRASNIIVRNVKVHHVLIGDKDCISIEGPADHIWIDHCELYNEYQGVDKDDYDGLLDAKKDAEYITYSWNYLHDSWKTMLIGSSETDVFDRKLTMHHNRFENCNSRLPLFRGSTGHFFNNYFKDIASTTINSRINSCVYIENNYFENAMNPWVSAYSEILGGGDTTRNILVNSPFVYSSDTHELPYCTFTIPYSYEEVLHPAESIPALLLAYTGVGKLNSVTTPVYTLNKEILGSGSLTIEPEKVFYDSSEVVSLTPLADPDWEFGGWSGDTSGTDIPLLLTMNGNKHIIATFTTDKLSLNYQSVGPGSVSAEPDKPLYDPGEIVTLTALANPDGEFVAWSGAMESTDNPLEIQIDSNTNILATFRYIPADSLTIQLEEEYCELMGIADTKHTGYTGSGFIDFENVTGAYVDFPVEALAEGSAEIIIRYAHGKTDDRSLKIVVNGITQVEYLDFPTTGDFTIWSNVTSQLELSQGDNLIRLEALTANGGANLDRVSLTSPEINFLPGNCSNIPEIISAPSGLTAFAGETAVIQLQWTDNADNETGYRIERKSISEGFATLTELAENSTSYSDMSISDSVEYTYRILAFGNAGESPYSNEASAVFIPPIENSQTAMSGEFEFRIFPNPSDGDFQLYFYPLAEGSLEVTLYNLLGEQVYTQRIETTGNLGTSYSINPGRLEKGYYFIGLQWGNYTAVRKIARY